MATTYIVANGGKVSGMSGVGFVWPLVTSDADIADAVSGDLIIWNNAAGVALTDYDSDTNTIVVDWAGCYVFDVKANDAAIEVMQPVYFDDTTYGDIRDTASGNTFVGYALEAVGSGETKAIKIKFGLMQAA